MEKSESMVVRGEDGLRGTIETSLFLGGSQPHVLVQLDDGQQILVPSHALLPQPDGSHYLLPSPIEPYGSLGAETAASGEALVTIALTIVPDEPDLTEYQIEVGQADITHIAPSPVGAANESLGVGLLPGQSESLSSLINVASITGAGGNPVRATGFDTDHAEVWHGEYCYRPV